MVYNPRIKPRHALLGVLFLLLLSYSLFQARFLILGPRIWIESPEDGAQVFEPMVKISGRASNIAWISLNGSPIFTNEEGFWEEVLIVSKGTSIMTLSAKDRFGRETEESVRIILN